MSCSQVFADAQVIRKRQITGRRGHAVSTDNDRAVVKRRIVFKNIDQKLARDDSVHRDSRAFDLRKRSVALDDDQGSCLYFSHFKGRTGNLIYGLLCISFLLSGILRNKKVCDDIFASELLQRFSKLRLEDNDEGCQYELAHMVDDPGDRI